MAVQLSHPQGAYVCGFCSFKSPDYKILVKHLLDHCGFKERKHEHILWCGLCKPSLTDGNRIDSHQQSMTNEVHLSGSVYHDSNDFAYRDSSNYYQGYNVLYNPYAFHNAYYYPMNVTYRNASYGNDGYYQTRDSIFYTDDFYDGTDILPILNTTRFIESTPEDKYISNMPYNSENIHDVDSFAGSSSITLSDFEYKSNDSNSVNSDSGIETQTVGPQISPEEKSVNKSCEEYSIGDTGILSKCMVSAELNVVKLTQFENTSNIETQPEVKSTIQPGSDKTLSGKLNGSEAKKIARKRITDPKLNAVKRYPFQANVFKANNSKVPKNLTELNLEFLSEAVSKGVGSSVVGTSSGMETNSINVHTDTVSISALNKDEDGCSSKIPIEKLTESSENDESASFTEQLAPVSFPEATCKEKILINDVSDAKNCETLVEVDYLPENTTKECNSSQLHASKCEASSESFLGKGSIPAQNVNAVAISDAKSSKVYATLLTADTLYVETGSIDKSRPPMKIDLNEIHSECPVGESETLFKIKNSTSVLSEHDTPVSTVKPSPEVKVVTDRENNVSNIQIQTTSINRKQKTKKGKELCNSKKGRSYEGDYGGQAKITRDASNQKSIKSKDSCIGAITESSKKCQSDKTSAPSSVGNTRRNSYQNDLNLTNKIYGSVLAQNQVRLTYSEVVKRGLQKSQN